MTDKEIKKMEKMAAPISVPGTSRPKPKKTKKKEG